MTELSFKNKQKAVTLVSIPDILVLVWILVRLLTVSYKTSIQTISK